MQRPFQKTPSPLCPPVEDVVAPVPPVHHLALARQQLANGGPGGVLVARLGVAGVGEVGDGDVDVAVVCGGISGGKGRGQGRGMRRRLGLGLGLGSGGAAAGPCVARCPAQPSAAQRGAAKRGAPVQSAKAGSLYFIPRHTRPKSSVATRNLRGRFFSTCPSSSLCTCAGGLGRANRWELGMDGRLSMHPGTAGLQPPQLGSSSCPVSRRVCCPEHTSCRPRNTPIYRP